LIFEEADSYLQEEKRALVDVGDLFSNAMNLEKGNIKC
jgi:hypothetical protein